MKRSRYKGVVPCVSKKGIRLCNKDKGDRMLKVEVQRCITKGMFSLYAAEDKGGYRIGDFVKRVRADTLYRDYGSATGFFVPLK